MSNQVPVKLHVYDLSRGMAGQLSMQFLGESIEAVYHTGVEVYGEEYFYGGGIVHSPHADVVRQHGLAPFQTLELGTTTKTWQEFISFLSSINSRFTAQTYSLLRNNCNNFSDEACKFLLNGVGIPEHILNLPSRFARTPMGQMFLPMMENMESQFNQVPGAIPFSSSTAAAAAAASTPPPPPPTTTTSTTTTTTTTSSSSTHPDMDDSSDALKLSVIITSGSEQKSLSVSLKQNATIGGLKQILQMLTGYLPDDMRLIFQGQVLKDSNAFVTSCGIKSNQALHLVPKHGASTTSINASTSSNDETAPLASSLNNLKSKVADAQFVTAKKTLLKVIQNIEEHPSEEKYRKINRGNAIFEKRISSLPGGPECMLALGFNEVTESNGDRFFVLIPSAPAWEKLQKCKSLLGDDEQPRSNITNSTSSLPSINNNNNNNNHGFGGLGAGMNADTIRNMVGGMDMSSLASDPRFLEVLRNPEMVQQMLNSPLVQQMASTDPQMSAQLNMLRSNPGLLSSLAPMMQNMMGQQQQRTTPSSITPNSTSNSSGDHEMTEEEMINEAIERSLREQ